MIGPIAWIHPSRSGPLWESRHRGSTFIHIRQDARIARSLKSEKSWPLSAISYRKPPWTVHWWTIEPSFSHRLEVHVVESGDLLNHFSTPGRGVIYCWPRKKKKENVRNIGKYGAVDDWPTNAGFSMSRSRSKWSKGLLFWQGMKARAHHQFWQAVAKHMQSILAGLGPRIPLGHGLLLDLLGLPRDM